MVKSFQLRMIPHSSEGIPVEDSNGICFWYCNLNRMRKGVFHADNVHPLFMSHKGIKP